MKKIIFYSILIIFLLFICHNIYDHVMVTTLEKRVPIQIANVNEMWIENSEGKRELSISDPTKIKNLWNTIKKIKIKKSYKHEIIREVKSPNPNENYKNKHIVSIGFWGTIDDSFFDRRICIYQDNISISPKENGRYKKYTIVGNTIDKNIILNILKYKKSSTNK